MIKYPLMIKNMHTLEYILTTSENSDWIYHEGVYNVINDKTQNI